MKKERNGRGAYAVTVQGSLLPPDFLQSIASLGAPFQDGSDYGLTRSFTLKDEISRYWRIANDLYSRYGEKLAGGKRKPETICRKEWIIPFLESVLGYSLAECGRITMDDRVFPLSHTSCGAKVPVLLASPGSKPDSADNLFGEKGRKRSPSGLIQELLNGKTEWTWGLFCNGSVLRLFRENPSLTRSSFIEADLELIFQEQLYSDFALLWLLFHVSRIDPDKGSEGKCILEQWRAISQAEGERALGNLRDGVKGTLLALGNGFLSFPGNEPLRKELSEGNLTAEAFFEELLRLVYRFLFLFSAEERHLLFAPDTDGKKKDLYHEGYALSRLRDRALRRRSYDRHPDLWKGLLVLFGCLENGAPALGLTPLGGLFSSGHCPHLESSDISNEALLEAVRSLSFFRTGSSLARVNYRDMGTEELGSVYESLLELHPFIDVESAPWTFRFFGDDDSQSGGRGSSRKLSGSYYTPSSLVNEIIRSALEPAVRKALKSGNNPRQSLLSLRVIDPACGSGHFLLAAARVLALELARIDSETDTPDEISRQHAFREVVRTCIYGVDRNPLAVELCRTALWIESLEPGKPLAFLDPHIQCGDSLVGILDPSIMDHGIPEKAYEKLGGDVSAVCSKLKKKNKEEVENRLSSLFVGEDTGISVSRVAETGPGYLDLPEDDLIQVREKKKRWMESLTSPEMMRKKTESDLFVSAFFMKKTEQTFDSVPTTEDLLAARTKRSVRAKVKNAVEKTAEKYSFFHWHIAFPDIMHRGGFDVVLGNPPWERVKLQEQEFFSSRSPWIAGAPNAAERKKRIDALKKPNAPLGDRMLALAFAEALRGAECASSFLRTGGRFPLTGVGDVNLYALFAEAMTQLAGKGRAGFIVPSGIATDNSTRAFFDFLISKKRLESLYDFENRERIFPAVDSRQKFCLLTLAQDVPEPCFVFFATRSEHLVDERRRFTLTSDDVERINPNTKTSPIFRSNADAGLTKKMYGSVPVLLDENRGAEGNPWGISFSRLFDMSNDSELFRTFDQLHRVGAVRDGVKWQDEEESVWVPLYEAKMVHQFDSRWATYEQDGNTVRDCTENEKKKPGFQPLPRYWVPQKEVDRRLSAKGWNRQWLMGWRNITNATNERTVISSVIPRVGVGHSMPLYFLNPSFSPEYWLAFLSNMSSLVLDYVARQSVGGTNLTYGYLKQFPVLTPDQYTKDDLRFLCVRAQELVYTSLGMRPFAEDLGFSGPPFPWNPGRRALLRAELDAYYAMLYGLTRDELRYILDPADVKGDDYPSETFRVLKNNEIRNFGEYRTARLVLQAWDRLEENGWKES